MNIKSEKKKGKRQAFILQYELGIARNLESECSHSDLILTLGLF